jgi:hypothetical protein
MKGSLMKIRTLVVAIATVGLATLTLVPANAVTHRAQAGKASAKAANPCSFDSQAGGAVEKISGPGPRFDGGYSLSGTERSGTCVKVIRGQQHGRYTHTVVVRSQGVVQSAGYSGPASVTPLAHNDGSRCHVNVTVKVHHPFKHTGVYRVILNLPNCSL